MTTAIHKWTEAWRTSRHRGMDVMLGVSTVLASLPLILFSLTIAEKDGMTSRIFCRAI